MPALPDGNSPANWNKQAGLPPPPAPTPAPTLTSRIKAGVGAIAARSRSTSGSSGGGGGYSGGGGGGGVGAPAPLPPASLGESPAWLAFQRQLDLEANQAQTATQDRIDVLNRGLARDIPDIQKAGEFTREGISGNFEARGVYRSGAHEQGLARQREAEGRQISGLQGTVNDQVGLLLADLARRQADIARRKADAALEGAGEIYR